MTLMVRMEGRKLTSPSCHSERASETGHASLKEDANIEKQAWGFRCSTLNVMVFCPEFKSDGTKFNNRTEYVSRDNV